VTIEARTAGRAVVAPPAAEHGDIPLFPTLWPHMLRRRVRSAWPFPIQQPQARPVYLARYGIYEAVRQLGLAGREVLFPAFFHSVELDALVAAGAHPRFFAVGDDLRVDPQAIAARIGPSTAAVYLIHYAGFPGTVDALSELCRERGLLLIEDCAHSLLSSLGDRPLGSFGDAAVFSLPKVVPVPNGGVATVRAGWPVRSSSRQRPLAAAVAAHAGSSLLRNFQMRGIPGTSLLRRSIIGLGKAAFRHAGIDHMPTGTPVFTPAHLALTMSSLSWRVLAGQDFAGIVARRRRNYRRLQDRLRDVAPTMLGDLPPGVSPLFYPFLTDDRERVQARLLARGIEIGEFWPEWPAAVPRHEFPDVERLRRRALWLPCHQDLSVPAIDRLADAVADVLDEVPR
jgi:selenocysteine lyase/cysteine desulfurase